MLEIQEKTKFLPFIKKIVTFRFLGEQELSEILNQSQVLMFKDGETIVTQGEVNQSFYAVIKGAVQVNVEDSSQESNNVYICTIGEGEVFGEAGMFLKVKRTANVTAMDECLILKVDRQDMMSFIKRRPMAGNKILMVIIYSLLKKLKEANQELAYERQSDADQSDIDAIVSEFM